MPSRNRLLNERGQNGQWLSKARKSEGDGGLRQIAPLVCWTGWAVWRGPERTKKRCAKLGWVPGQIDTGRSSPLQDEGPKSHRQTTLPPSARHLDQTFERTVESKSVSLWRPDGLRRRGMHKNLPWRDTSGPQYPEGILAWTSVLMSCAIANGFGEHEDG